MELRAQKLAELDGGHFDVLVIGGGINGAVSAASLAARGVKVGLVERDDFASFTSQESSNLVWGGFKYLENYELKLVWDLCTSRNHMLRSYPTQIVEIDFLATLDESAPFPVALAALGAVGYWAIGRFATKAPRFFRPSAIKAAEPIVDVRTAKGGIRYADAYLPDNDARFVWGFVRSALDHGASAANYVSVERAVRVDDRWEVTLHDREADRSFTTTATAIVNAAGPFIDGLNAQLELTTEHRIVYSKGIHLVVPRINESERVLAFFDDTGRLFYVIPMAHRSVIGTTDTRTDRPDEGVLDEDRTFLLDQINARLELARPLTKADIIAERCGVRPLVVDTGGDDRTETDWTSLSRKHEIEVDHTRRVVSVFGGKLTDCLNVGDEVSDAVDELGIRQGPPAQGWFGEPSDADRDRFYAEAAARGLDRAPEIERAATMAEVLWRRHGNAAFELLELIDGEPAMAQPVLATSDVLRAELPLMAEREMIVRPHDFLRRRTKLDLVIHRDQLGSDPGMAEVDAAFGF